MLSNESTDGNNRSSVLWASGLLLALDISLFLCIMKPCIHPSYLSTAQYNPAHTSAFSAPVKLVRLGCNVVVFCASESVAIVMTIIIIVEFESDYRVDIGIGHNLEWHGA